MYKTIDFPSKTEYPSYAEMYMDYVKRDGSLLKLLHNSLLETKGFIVSLSDEALNYKYAPNKWSVKEVLVHIVDDERIYAYRALAFARNDKTILPGFDENEYTKYSDTDSRSMSTIIEEYEMVRKSTIALFNGFSEEALLRIGEANNNKTSVRALGYHILGHELHHLHVIREKYLAVL